MTQTKVKLFFASGMTKTLLADTSKLDFGRVVTLPAPVGRYVLGELVKWEVIE